MVHKSLLVQLNFIELIPTFCNLCWALGLLNSNFYCHEQSKSRKSEIHKRWNDFWGTSRQVRFKFANIFWYFLYLSFSCLTFQLQRRVGGFKVIAMSATRIDTKVKCFFLGKILHISSFCWILMVSDIFKSLCIINGNLVWDIAFI